MEKQEIDNLRKAGKFAAEAIRYAKTIIRKGVLLVDIAEKIEAKIIELGGKPAFPVSLGIDEIAAHYTPSHNEETKASGLLKIDLGVSVNGYVDYAFGELLTNKIISLWGNRIQRIIATAIQRITYCF